MLKSFNNLSLQYKLIFYFLVLILLPILIIGLLTNIIFSNAMENAASESTFQAINQVNISIETNVKNIENVINTISRHPQILDFFRLKPSDNSDKRDIIESTDRSFLAGLTENYQEIEGIALISYNDLFISNEMYKVVQDPLTDERWYQECVQGKDGIYLTGGPVGRKIAEYKRISADEIVTIIKAVRDPSNDDIIGVVVIDLRTKVLEDVLNNTKLGKSGFIYIIDSNGGNIFSPINYIIPRVRNQWFEDKPSGVFNKYILGQHFQFIYSTSAYTKWKVVGVFSLNETLKEVANIRLYTFLILVIISIIAVGVSVVVSSSIANPIGKLRRLMKKAESGDLSVEFEVKYEDEIGQLGRSFNTMIAEIKKLIDVVYNEQKSKREAELRTLQSQIKPHFLYNTLDTIHWMAKKYGAKDVIQVISALTNLFRIGLSKGNEVIRLSEEIEHVKSYLVIQKVRYEEMLEYDIEVDEDINNLYVQKLILQPIVENAIYHGIKEKKEPGRIKITAQVKEDMLIFTIEDNGVGIPDDKLEKINFSLSNESGERFGYGTFNVNERIQLSYGKGYGIVINSIVGMMTEVMIKHPIIKNLKG
jgi:two-component system, sensor histidine kinase YesM